MIAIARALACLTVALGNGPDDPAAVDFNRDVRPILSEHCFGCHGPDARQRKAGLRLDTKDGLFEAREDGAVVLPGQAEDSPLLQRITEDDPTVRMPPPKAGRGLNPEQVETLRRWIAQGAEWQGHWAYIPPTRPPVPRREGPPGFVRNPIDQFILDQQRRRDLQPAAEADRITLIRRLSFDLNGLPPTPAEVDAFVLDPAPDAYEKLVERLLASPRFGERMAMHWLDLVRYADTTGIHGDNHREVSLFRDYIIKSFNYNKPFDRLTVEQLAGDLLPGATWEQKVASGYNRLLMTTQEGGAQAKEYLAKYAADRVRNASTVWMGATLGCAECHDHKYDPFKTREFYSFAAFFADLQEVAVGEQPPTKIPTPEQEKRLAELDAAMAPLQKVLDTQTPELDSALAQWEQDRKARKIDWSPLLPIEARSQGGASLDVLEDGSIRATGTSPEKDVYTLTLKTGPNALTGLRLEVLPDDTLPAKGPGRASNGNFVLNELEAKANGAPLAWSSVTATHSQSNWDVVGAADGKVETGWAILPRAGRSNHAAFEAAADVPADADLTITLTFNYGQQHTLGRFRLSASSSPRPIRAEGVGLPKPVEEALAVEPEKRDDGQRARIAAYYRTIAPALEPARKSLADLKAEKQRIEAGLPTMLISISGPPRVMRVLPRGNWLDDSGEVVEPGVPAFLPSLGVDGRRATRLDLARWMVSRENPLVARVFVNRLWALLFGRGLVATPDDFGSQGAWPTHPHLLDWLAVEFMDSGWDVKHILALMATSGTYRQSSRADESARQHDPYNQWLARQGRFRLEAEMVRDNALAVSGLLVERLGGRSVKPYQPRGYWSHLNFPVREYEPSTGVDLYRRGVYTYWCRTFLHPSLLAFDGPTREECQVARTRSNTPLQALVLLNDPTYIEAARALAERVLRESDGTVEGRIHHLYRRVLSRDPRAEERALLAKLAAEHLAKYRADGAAAGELLHVGARPVPADLDAGELAAWTSVGRVVLNLHETITRD